MIILLGIGSLMENLNVVFAGVGKILLHPYRSPKASKVSPEAYCSIFFLQASFTTLKAATKTAAIASPNILLSSPGYKGSFISCSNAKITDS